MTRTKSLTQSGQMLETVLRTLMAHGRRVVFHVEGGDVVVGESPHAVSTVTRQVTVETFRGEIRLLECGACLFMEEWEFEDQYDTGSELQRVAQYWVI